MTSRNNSAGERPACNVDSIYEDRAEIGAMPSDQAAALSSAIAGHLTDRRASIRNAATMALLDGNVAGLVKALPHEQAREIGAMALEVYNGQR